jgi:uncharacterized protein (TIGR02444 family)
MALALELENPFWQFSLTVYAIPGVEQECLGLQQRHAVDVNLLLACAWCGTKGLRLNTEHLDHLIKASCAWQAEVVRPLRHTRFYLKQMTSLQAGEAAALRKELAAVELRTEQIEQAILFAEIDRDQFAQAEQSADAVGENIDAYLARYGESHETTPVLLAASLEHRQQARSD